jgi:hypothetical protein
MHSSFESYASAGLWKAGYATFPQALENPPGFPQLHSYDDDEMKQRKPLISYRGTILFREGVSSPTFSPRVRGFEKTESKPPQKRPGRAIRSQSQEGPRGLTHFDCESGFGRKTRQTFPREPAIQVF